MSGLPCFRSFVLLIRRWMDDASTSPSILPFSRVFLHKLRTYGLRHSLQQWDFSTNFTRIGFPQQPVSMSALRPTFQNWKWKGPNSSVWMVMALQAKNVRLPIPRGIGEGHLAHPNATTAKGEIPTVVSQKRTLPPSLEGTPLPPEDRTPPSEKKTPSLRCRRRRGPTSAAGENLAAARGIATAVAAQAQAGRAQNITGQMIR